MKKIKNYIKNASINILTLIKWLLISTVVGLIGGILGSVFHLSIDYVTELRTQHSFLIYLLPLGGVVIALMYKLFSKKGRVDTNRVIESVREEKDVPLVMIPLIFFSTLITHFLGGSAGREGAALQLGGSIGYNLGNLFKLNKRQSHIIVMSGMSAVFSALFGTPITATVFSLEVTNVGTLHYAGLVPCVVSSVIASFIAKTFKIHPVAFLGIDFGDFSFKIAFSVVVLSLLCAVLSILFCVAIKKCEHIMAKFFKNSIFRSFVGGLIIVLLTIIVGTRDYNGAGMDVITKALSGFAKYEAPILKILFTAITIAAGFRGGEIVPTFFIGATFGCVVGPILGLDPSVAAAIGFVAMFCCVVNCPIASIFLSIEVFGMGGLLLFAIATGVSYMMSGCFGLYESQKILYSKIDDEYIDSFTN